MRTHRIAVLLGLFLIPGAAAAQQAHEHAGHSQYAGMQGREIKALDSTAVANYLSGAGMGFALSAELNGYPGPRHVLELADSLALTAAQRTAVEASFAKMESQAIAAGEQIVELERQLDQRFAHRHVDAKIIEDLTSRIAALNGRLRAIHLTAHLEVTAALNDAQVTAYNRLRGYH
jgi:hypothetical protein